MQKLTKKIILTSLTTLLFIGCASKPKPVYSYQFPWIPIKIIKYDNGDYKVKAVPQINTGLGTLAVEDS